MDAKEFFGPYLKDFTKVVVVDLTPSLAKVSCLCIRSICRELSSSLCIVRIASLCAAALPPINKKSTESTES